MIFSFDYNGNYEYPVIILARPDFEEIAIIEQAKGLKFTPRFNTISEVEFIVYQYHNDILIPYYDRIRKNKLIKLHGIGWFIIDEVREDNDGGIPFKTIKCFSYEYTLNNKGINLFNGTYKFYDLYKPEGTLLYQLVQVLPNWSIGHVDISLLNQYRTFDIPDATLYGFMTKEVSTTYECLFMFDVDNLQINVYDPKNVVKKTGIILTFDNINKHISVSELSNEITTVLRVNGADNLSIDRVNPIGGNKIYNFHYYMNEDWINDEDLIAKIKQWEKEISESGDDYFNLLDLAKALNREMIKLKAALVDLNNELNALEIVRKQVLSIDDQTQLAILTAQINNKNKEINMKQKEIDNKQKEIDNNTTNLNNVRNTLRFETYFTKEELIKLDPYIIEQIYNDENFIVTDEMNVSSTDNGERFVLTTVGIKQIKDLTETDILINEQYIANQLLEQGYKVLSRISQPSFSFELEALNFLFVEKFKPFSKQIELGYMLNVEIKEGDWAYPFLLEMQIEYDNPTNFSMTFGNRFRLGTSEWTFGDLYNETSKVSGRVGSTLALASEPVLNGSISEMAEKLNSNIVAAHRQIMDTSDNEVSIGGFGLRLRKKDSNFASGYDPHQTWFNENLMVMTDDEWQTAKLAIGLVNGYYSVNAEIIAGNLIAGNQLIIQDGVKGQEATFIVDANGARLTNASFTLTTKDGKGRIVLNPNDNVGIRIQTNKTGTFNDVFYVDNNGYLMATDITATGGTIGGFGITTNRFYSTLQNSIISVGESTARNRPIIELNTDGTGRMSLLTWTPTAAKFSGELQSTSGTIGGFKIEAARLCSTQQSSSDFDDLNTADRRSIIDLRTNGTGRISLLSWTPTTARFTGRIEAKEGTIGGFNITANRLYSSTSDANGPIIDLNTYGTGRISLLSWTPTTAIFNGTINANSGTIGGWTIDAYGIRNPSTGQYINSNGTGKLGLMTYSTTTAIFDGNIYAKNLSDYVTNNNIGDDSINGDKLTRGSVRGNGNFGYQGHIVMGSVGTSDLSDYGVTRYKLDLSIQWLLDKIDTFGNLTSDVNTLKSDMTSVKSDISSIKSDISSIKSDISSIRGELNNIKGSKSFSGTTGYSDGHSHSFGGYIWI